MKFLVLWRFDLTRLGPEVAARSCRCRTMPRSSGTSWRVGADVMRCPGFMLAAEDESGTSGRHCR